MFCLVVKDFLERYVKSICEIFVDELIEMFFFIDGGLEERKFVYFKLGYVIVFFFVVIFGYEYYYLFNSSVV